MNFKNETQNLSRRTVLAGIAATLAEMAGCGGGGSAGSVAGLSSGGTGSFTSGVIMGLGSIIVNGIRYNNDSAQLISSDDGSSVNTSLTLGMVVSIQGSAVTPATTPNGLPTAVATKISLGSEWLGPIANINVGASTFTVLGNTVNVLSTTIFSGVATDLTQTSSLITNGAVFAEIYGFIDVSTGNLQATHIETSTTQPSFYKLSGVVTSYDGISNLQVGQTSISFDNTTQSIGNWGIGSQVRVQLGTATNLNRWPATKIQVMSSPLQRLNVADHDETEIHGPVTTRVSATNFYVNAIPVDASRISGFSAPNVGTTVEVQGNVVNGVVIATSINSKTVNQIQSQEFEFVGTVSQLTSFTPNSGTFLLKGITFNYSNSTSISGFNLANGIRVQVKATQTNGSWTATSIELED